MPILISPPLSLVLTDISLQSLSSTSRYTVSIQCTVFQSSIYTSMLPLMHRDISILNQNVVTASYGTGGCDFNPYLKHIRHRLFADVVIIHLLLITILIWEEVDSTTSSNSLLIKVLVILSFYENACATGGTSTKSIIRPPIAYKHWPLFRAKSQKVGQVI